jgi:enterobactin synthetase component D / holo-[acyl-carrier protein] synthase
VIERLLSPPVVTVEAFDDAEPAPLFPGEEALVAQAVPKRRHEFATGRRCARAALAQLGCPPAPLLTGPDRAPLWPDGVVGSITHTDGYRAAAVARATQLSSVGIDAEPNRPLPDGVLDLIASPAEAQALAALLQENPSIRWDRLLFCAKECVFKAWYPVTGRWLDFLDAQVTLDPHTSTFRADLPAKRAELEDGRVLTGFDGGWIVSADLLLASVLVPAGPVRL